MRALGVALAFLVLCGSAHAQTYVGVVEEHHGGVFPELRIASLRVAFVNNGTGWRPANAAGTPSSWTVGFDGRVVGEITSAEASGSALSTRGVRAIARQHEAPRIGSPSAEFGGWSGMVVHRPLVATTSGHVADPVGWRRTPLSASTSEALQRAFRARFPQVQNCSNSPANTARPWRYGDDAIVISATYASRDGWRIATAQLSDDNCDGPTEGTAFAPQVFAISPSNEVRFLDEGLWLVDAGDYDRDGASELIFAIDRYNEGGYALFSAAFTQHAEFSFSYH